MGQQKGYPYTEMFMPVKENGRGMLKKGGACVRRDGEYVVHRTKNPSITFPGQTFTISRVAMPTMLPIQGANVKGKKKKLTVLA